MESIPASVVYSLVSMAVLLLGAFGGMIARDRQILKMIHDGDSKNSDDLKKSEENLHERNSTIKRELSDKIDRTARELQDDMRRHSDSNDDHFVRKEHFESCMKNVGDGINRIEKAVHGLNTRIDEILK